MLQKIQPKSVQFSKSRFFFLSQVYVFANSNTTPMKSNPNIRTIALTTSKYPNVNNSFAHGSITLLFCKVTPFLSFYHYI